MSTPFLPPTKRYKLQANKGFTLLEIMLVVGLFAVVAGILIVTINPSRYYANARNIQRRADLERIQGALNEYSIERDGKLPSIVSSTLQMIGTATSTCKVTCGSGTASTSVSCVNLGTTLSPLYIQSMPIDPTTGSASKTYYAVQKLVYGTSTPTGLLIRACSTENSSTTVEIKQ
jgi:prepilin-type N-terminal cleavage/methylation domain-containing protein